MHHAGARALTGCDLQPVADVADAVADFGPRYLDRVYTVAEQQSLRSGGAASLAARFAGKEAVLKLVGSPDEVDLRTVEIGRRADGRPVVRLSGRAARLAAEARIGEIDLSLSHAGGLAMAVAVAIADPLTATTATHRPSTATGEAR